MTVSKARLEAEEKRRASISTGTFTEKIWAARIRLREGIERIHPPRAVLEQEAKRKGISGQLARAQLRMGWYT